MPLLQAQLEIPLLGVCLGFQALALAHGGQVTHAPEPVHGRLSAVQHNGHPLFRDIPSGAKLPGLLRITARLACDAGWTAGIVQLPRLLRILLGLASYGQFCMHRTHAARGLRMHRWHADSPLR